MEVHRFGIKMFAAQQEGVPLQEFIPVFHGWIQKQCVEGHLLIDVQDYSHMHNGPGILLAAHEGNFSMDMERGKLGLLYQRIQPIEGTPEDRIGKILAFALDACVLLEQEPTLSGRLHFRTDEFLIIANDRLRSPNEAPAFEELKGTVSSALRQFFSSVSILRVSENPKERLAAGVRTGESVDVTTLRNRVRHK